MNVVTSRWLNPMTEKVKNISIRVPNDLHHAARIKLFETDQTFQQFFVSSLENFVQEVKTK